MDLPAGNLEKASEHRAARASAAMESSLSVQPRSINVVLFGETGVSKSSIINLIAQKEVAQVSSDANGYTMQSTRYDISFDGMDFAIFDTIGFEEPQMEASGYLTAIEKAYELVVKLGAAGGIHLLLFCMRGGRITTTTQSNYRLFCEYLCNTKVPIALIFTYLGGEVVTEDRWQRHVKHCGIESNGHACITTVRGDTPEEGLVYTESQKKIRELLTTCALQNEAFSPELYLWFARLGRGLSGFVEKHRNPRWWDVLRILMDRCNLDPRIAKIIASIMEGDITEVEIGIIGSEDYSTILERLGDTAMDAKQYKKAVSHYSAALSLASSPAILIKRSKARLASGSSSKALSDANKAIALDSSSPWGYEMRHAALHEIGDYDNAIEAFEAMFSKMTNSPDMAVREQGEQYICPSSTRATIREIVERTTRRLPRVLINTATGRLRDKAEHPSVFETLPIFKRLVSSTTKRIHHIRTLKREVRRYFRYVVLSHRWEENEPLFHDVERIAVYDLNGSPTHDKLKMFCKIARDAGFRWAWSDTCCIDKSDPSVHQEALVAMFRWYRRSALMIVFLRGVHPSSLHGALAKSMWNTRAWTLQEYIAAKVVRFYTEDWTLYANLELPNHKESPVVISEMEQATGVPSQQLMALCPGLTNIREKLRIASTRTTTKIEDAAYSLLGIFSVIGIPAIYGEGEASLGRLLANVLTRSGEVSILAWTGGPSRFNSCLPARITVYDGTAAPHLPAPITDSEMECAIAGFCTPSFDLGAALTLYDRLDNLPTPRFAESRMSLPCIAFQLPLFSSARTGSGRAYRADTMAFGGLKIKTRHDLTQMNSLYLVHPWLDALLEHRDMPRSTSKEDEGILDGEVDSDNEEIDDDLSLPPERDRHLIPSPAPKAPLDRETRARQLVARLRQPFGALLFTMVSEGRRGGATEYRRVAADSLITVRIQENVSLTDILDHVRIIDVL